MDDPERALGTLDGSQHVIEAHRSDEGLRVSLAGDPATAALINATLVAAGVGVAASSPCARASSSASSRSRRGSTRPPAEEVKT